MQLIDTPVGPAGLDLLLPAGPPRAVVVLGHGAGGGVGAPDLVAVRAAAVSFGAAVALVTQPYRVAGRRAPAPAAQLDVAWCAVLRGLPDLTGVPLVVGGRSSGARVACRTARTVDAAAVLCLAFPVHPPGRPDKSRLPELDTGLPTLAVSGERDPFGVPPAAPGREVVVVPAAVHDLRRDLRAVGEAAVAWLGRVT
jgi:predicted alpha/beta-hydrolase family hydrolase